MVNCTIYTVNYAQYVVCKNSTAKIESDAADCYVTVSVISDNGMLRAVPYCPNAARAVTAIANCRPLIGPCDSRESKVRFDTLLIANKLVKRLAFPLTQ